MAVCVSVGAPTPGEEVASSGYLIHNVKVGFCWLSNVPQFEGLLGVNSVRGYGTDRLWEV